MKEKLAGEVQRGGGEGRVVHIELGRGVVALLIAGMLLVAFLGYLAWGQERVTASAPQAPEAVAVPQIQFNGLRRFYRTSTAYTPTLASTACVTGYHFASIWELLDPSNLEYAAEELDAWSGPLYDMGEGPITGADDGPIMAYARTGYNADVSGVSGKANCNNWQSDDENHYGTMVGLTHEWGSAEDMFIWNVGVNTCNVRAGVWCVED